MTCFWNNVTKLAKARGLTPFGVLTFLFINRLKYDHFFNLSFICNKGNPTAYGSPLLRHPFPLLQPSKLTLNLKAALRFVFDFTFEHIRLILHIS